jgi:hypothetical protein
MTQIGRQSQVAGMVTNQDESQAHVGGAGMQVNQEIDLGILF